jgi:hypothetical protein
MVGLKLGVGLCGKDTDSGYLRTVCTEEFLELCKEVMVVWRKLHNFELNNVYSSSNIKTWNN